jgi:hypothetical protein
MEPPSESPADRQRGFQPQVDSLGPAALGSLSRRRSPWGRQHGRPCLSEKQHLRDVLYGRLPGRPFSLDLPQALAPEVRRGLDNGGALPQRLPQAVAPNVHALQPQRIRAPQKGNL